MWSRWLLLLSIVCATSKASAQGALDCHHEIDPYYWGFDVPSMTGISGPSDVASARQDLIHYLWKQDGWPGDKMPAPIQTLWKADSLNFDCTGAVAPPALPGLALWLDATDPSSVIVDGDRIMTWLDKSGHGNDAIQTAISKMPNYDPEQIHGASAVHFDGVEDVLSIPDDPTLDLAHATIFMVVKVEPGGNVPYPLPLSKLPVNSSYLFWIDAATQISAFRVKTGSDSTYRDAVDLDPLDGEPEVWTGWQGSDSVRFFRNGNAAGAGIASGTVVASAGALSLGSGDPITNWNAFSGSIAEVVVYDHALSDDEREEVTAYLACKYGIQRFRPTWTRKLVSSNLGRVDRFDIAMDYDLHSYPYLLTPAHDNGRLLIFHQGHADDVLVTGGQETIQYFLDLGFSVFVFSMPGYAENSKVARRVTGNADVDVHDHNQMAVLENERGSFIRFFVEPVIVGINWAVAQQRYRDINMIGISGGGWTTHLVAALDPRVSLSFPVAGSLPMYLRSGPCDNGSWGDAEQIWPALYDGTLSWIELYLLGGYGQGRGQVQILNQFDDCCFWGVNYRTYEPFVSAEEDRLGAGFFRVFLDTLNTHHSISNFVIQSVIDPLLRAGDPVAVSAGADDAILRPLELRIRPNPSSGTTAIVYQLPESVAEGKLVLDLYDLGGRLVRRLSPWDRTAGTHTALWDGRDRGGRLVAPGVYLCRLDLGGRTATTRIVVTH